MRILESRLEKHINLLIERYPLLKACRQEIIDAYLIMEECYEHDGKLLIAGNGGSAADSEHIAGELMKRFKTPRPVTPEMAEKLKEMRFDGTIDFELSLDSLQEITATHATIEMTEFGTSRAVSACLNITPETASEDDTAESEETPSASAES